MIRSRVANNRRSYNRTTRDVTFDNINQTTRNKVPRFPGFPQGEGAAGDPGMVGEIIFNSNTDEFYGHNGSSWQTLSGINAPVDALYVTLAPDPTLINERILTAGTGIVVTDGGAGGPVTVSTVSNLTNACPSGVSLVVNGSGPDFSIAGLVAGSGITIGTGPCITISSFVNLQNACDTGISLVIDGTGPGMFLRGLEEGTGVNLFVNGSCVNISSFVNLVDNCTDVGMLSRTIVLNGSGPNLLVRGLRSGTGIMLLNDSSCIIVCASGATEAIMIQNACATGTSLVVDGSGPIFELKSLIGGTAVDLSDDGSCITIGSTTTLASASIAGETLVSAGNVPGLLVKSLIPGTSINMSSDSSTITISATGDNITLANACPSGVSLVNDGSGPDLVIAGLVAGTGVDISSDGSCVTISADASALNTFVRLEPACLPNGNVSLVGGNPAGISGPNLLVKCLAGGTGITLFSDSTVVTIAATGDNITLVNACPSGVSLVVNGSGPDLVIAGLVAGTGVTLNSDGSCITIISTGGGSGTALCIDDLCDAITVSESLGLGTGALVNIGSGLRNTAVGAQALNALTSQNDNTALGHDALTLSTSNELTAVGANALASLTTGTFSTAVGYSALSSMVGSLHNTAVGHNAAATLIGSQNTAVGSSALANATTAGQSTAIGYLALEDVTSGQRNTGVGANALRSITTGSDCVAIGENALASNTASENTAVGAATLDSNSSGARNVALGYHALSLNSTASDCVAVGHNALDVSNAADNTAVGSGALSANTSGINNTAVGSNTLTANTIGSRNTAVGMNAADAVTTGTFHTAMGFNALGAATGGTLNACFGAGAGAAITTGSDNTCIGANTSVPGTGINRTALGESASATSSDDMIRLGNTSIGLLECEVALTVTSDRRKKKNIEDCSIGLEFIDKLRPVKFNMHYEESESRRYGFIAQEVQAVMQETGHLDFGAFSYNQHDDVYHLTYENFIAPLTKAVQELKQENTDLKSALNALTARVEQLEH